MLAKLKKEIKKEGAAKVASDLGYRSAHTLSHWIKNKSVPRIARDKVKIYLKQKGY